MKYALIGIIFLIVLLLLAFFATIRIKINDELIPLHRYIINKFKRERQYIELGN